MHPVIAAFLDVKTAVETLERGVAGIPMGPDAMAFVAAARTHSELSAYVLQAKGKETPGDDSQNATILLAVRAALSRIPSDPVLGPQAKRARDALAAAGADAEQVEQLLGGVLVEEAFTGDNDPNRFDSAFVHESFGELIELARLDEDQVTTLMDEVAKNAPPPLRPMQVSCAEALFQAAWADGTQSINVEHVEDALQMLSGDDPAEVEGVRAGLEVVLNFLNGKKLIGPLRLQRLIGHLKEWSPADAEAAELDDDEVDDGEDEDLDDETAAGGDDDDAADGGDGEDADLDGVDDDEDATGELEKPDEED
ncbi:MAG: hypothetical protein IPJ65_16320 [Archangiaceae bacterium]|nr:hypothetical protein [Archangiaceae bacterium]